MPNQVLHFEVTGSDPKRLQVFYQDVFGWQMSPAGPDYAMAMPGGESGINGGIGAGGEGASGHVTFYVEVEDLEAMLGRIAPLGRTLVMAPTDVPQGPRIAMFADPEGPVIGLTQAGTNGSQRQAT